MARSLRGRTALVTGAGKRIGRAIALGLAKEGVNIVAHYHRSRTEAEALIEECASLGTVCYTVAADLGDALQAQSLPGRSAELAGALHIVVNNASIFPSDSINDFSATSIDENVRVNATAPALIARSFAELGGQGDVINLLDARMLGNDEAHMSYHLSKRMLHALTKLMAVEFAPRIRVNGIAPGLILPPEGRDDSYLESLAHTNPMNARGTTEDVVEAAVFLLCSEFTTGQVIFVDGGRHMLGGLHV